MATDIAFALGVLALVASSAPIGLRVFLMALAIVDDLIAIIVIAIFYTSDVRFEALGVAAGCLVILIAMNRLRIGQPSFFFLIGDILWLGRSKSGVHATIAGVLIAMCVPVSIIAAIGSSSTKSTNSSVNTRRLTNTSSESS